MNLLIDVAYESSSCKVGSCYFIEWLLNCLACKWVKDSHLAVNPDFLQYLLDVGSVQIIAVSNKQIRHFWVESVKNLLCLIT